MVSSLNPSVNLCVYSMEIYTKDMLSKFIRDVYAHSCMRAVQLLYTPQTNSSRGCIGWWSPKSKVYHAGVSIPNQGGMYMYVAASFRELQFIKPYYSSSLLHHSHAFQTIFLDHVHALAAAYCIYALTITMTLSTISTIPCQDFKKPIPGEAHVQHPDLGTFLVVTPASLILIAFLLN